ncbi:DsrE family protein [Desulfocurvus sp. DL9XJH121]
MISNVGIIITHPQGDERMALGVRTAFAAQAEGYETLLVFLGQGVFSLVGEQSGYLRDMIATFQANEGRVACLKHCLESRGIAPDAFSFDDVDVLDDGELAEALEDVESINTF